MSSGFIPVAEPLLGQRELDLVTDCVKSGWISSLGRYIPMFEEQFSAFCESKYGVATSNGTTALHLALVALGIGPGDEVLVPDMTFIATANAVAYTGATPVLVDSEPVTWTMDPVDMARRITPRTKAVIPVHLYGHPCDMDVIMADARRHNLVVIEDAAEAHGALYHGRRVGGLADVGCFSFYANKIITTGEGGMITTNNKEWADKCISLRDHGMSKTRRYYHPVVGFNYRMTNLQAAVGVAQMERIADLIERKRGIAALYNQRLGGVRGLTLPPEEAWARNVYWMYSVLIDEKAFGCDAAALMAYLREKQIDSRPFFVPMHENPPYARSGGYPVSTRLGRQGINLPSAPSLDASDIARITDAIRSRGGA
jgi:perosamine synthetase